MIEVRASHILVKDEALAKDLLERINKGTSFEKLAKEHSECPSGEEGGDLGWFGKGMMVRPFEEACFSMAVGETSQPVRTQFGWHLIKLTGLK